MVDPIATIQNVFFDYRVKVSEKLSAQIPAFSLGARRIADPGFFLTGAIAHDIRPDHSTVLLAARARPSELRLLIRWRKHLPRDGGNGRLRSRGSLPIGAGDSGGTSSQDPSADSGSQVGSGTGGEAGTSAGGGGVVWYDAGGDTCGASRVGAEAKRVNVLLVIDKSGSMADTPMGFTTDKWSALKTALASALDQVKGGLSLGLELYPYTTANDPIPLKCSSTTCCSMATGPAAINIPIDVGTTSLPAINTALNFTGPGGGTPTAAALKQALADFTTGAGMALQGDKFILLATDGAPNCNPSATCDKTSCTQNIDDPKACGGTNCCVSDLGKNACVDGNETVAQITALKAAGISTFVIGIPGTELYSSFLNAFAVAGGETNPNGPAQYYAVDAKGGVGGLTAVFKSITTTLIKSCGLQLGSDPPEPSKLNVVVDGKIVPQSSGDGGADGWELDTTTSPPTVRLKGAICQNVQANGANTLEVIYGCPTVFIN